MFVDVAVPQARSPGKDFYTYFSDKSLKIGSLVEVPFGKKTVFGIVFADKKSSDVRNVLPILRVALPEPVLAEKQLWLLTWLCYYYHTAMSQVVTQTLPQFSRAFLKKHAAVTEEEPLHAGRPRQSLLLAPTVSHAKHLSARLAEKHIAHAIYDSSQSMNRRLTTYLAIRSGEISVVVATRSGLFLPFTRLAKLYLYDEHDWSYKELRSPTYHTVDVAEKLAELHGITLHIVDPTPRIQTYYKAAKQAKNGFPQVQLTSTTHSKRLPAIIRINVQKDYGHVPQMLADESRSYVQQAVAGKKPVLLFLNKKNDGGITKCANCDYFAYTPNALATCPKCGRPTVSHNAINLKTVAKEVGGLLSMWNIRHGLWQSDKSGSILTLTTNSSEITIATQKIFAADLSQPFSLGISIMADSFVSLPEFRSLEKAFAQLVQLRSCLTSSGNLILQTANQNQQIFNFFASNQYQEFAKSELKERKALGYPPFKNLILASFEAKTVATAKKHGDKLIQNLQTATGSEPKDAEIELIGPFFALHNPSQIRILLKGTNRADFDRILALIPSNWRLDFDPENILI